MSRMGVCKRVADVPWQVRRLGSKVSKADLLEAAFWLAAATTENADDPDLALSSLLHELNVHREARGQKPILITTILTGKSMSDLEREAEGWDAK